MLSNAADYRYLTPIAAGIHGGILPAVDNGTGAASVVAYEDYCHLVEAARERERWNSALQQNPDIIRNFDASSVVADRETLEDLSYYARHYHTFSESWDCAVVKHDRTDPTFPIFRLHSLDNEYAFDVWRASTGTIPRLSPQQVERTVEADTLRRLYRDIDNMKRWVFWCGGHSISSADFAAMESYDSYPRHLVGPVSNGGFLSYDESVGGDPAVINGPASPFFAVSLYGGDEKVSYIVPKSNSGLGIFIRKPFCRNDLTNELYYQRVGVYLGFGCEVAINTSASGGRVYHPTMFIDWGTASVTRNDYREFGAAFGVALAPPTLRGLCELFYAWIQDHKPVQGEIEYYSVELSHVAIDTGVVTHNTALPSSWDWQPQQGQ